MNHEGRRTRRACASPLARSIGGERMTARRRLTSLVVALTAVNAGRAQSVDLTEAPLADRCFRIELTLELKGKISVRQQGETVSFPHEAEARHVYVERVLQATGGVAGKTARHRPEDHGTDACHKQCSRQ